jgi:hypothetical protein
MEITGGMIIGTTITIITALVPVRPSAPTVRIAPTAPIVRDRPGRRIDLPEDSTGYPLFPFAYERFFL